MSDIDNNRGKKKMGGKKSSYRDRQAISYQQGADPPFLAQMKKQLGYKEWTVEDKFKDDNQEEAGVEDSTLDREDIRNMPEEERPQIVVMDPQRDISSEQLQVEIDKKREEEEKQKILDGKITFRKPEKRTVTEEKSTKRGVDEKKQRREDDKQNSKQGQATENRRLLSFGDDEEG